MGDANGNGNGSGWRAQALGILALIGGIAAVITPMYGGLSSIAMSVQKIEDRAFGELDRLHKSEVDSAYHKGQTDQQITRLDADVARMREAIVALDNTLQREMRDLDRIQETRIDNMDRRLQQEMGTLATTINSRSDAISARVTRIDELVPQLWLRRDQERFEDRIGVK